MDDFKVGDKVTTSWCWGEIEEILDDNIAVVSYCTGTGGGCLNFEFTELTKITNKGYNNLMRRWCR